MREAILVLMPPLRELIGINSLVILNESHIDKTAVFTFRNRRSFIFLDIKLTVHALVACLSLSS